MLPNNATICQSGSFVYAYGANGALIKKERIGLNDTGIIKAAIDVVPTNGNIYIGPGIYNLEAKYKFALNPDGSNPFWSCIPVLDGKNIHLCGAGVGATVLRLAANQHKIGHPVAMVLSRATGPFGRGFTAFSISNMTLDGNRANQGDLEKSKKDGAGLILTGSARSGGRYINLELINSFGSGIYLGNNGSGPECGSILENIVAKDCFTEGVILDTARNSVVSNCIFERCTTGLDVYGNTDYPTRARDGLVVSNITSDSPITVWCINDLLLSNINMDVSSCSNAYGLLIRDSHVHVHDSKFVSDKNKPNSYGGASYIAGASRAYLKSCHLEGYYALHALDKAVVFAQGCTLAASDACIYERDVDPVYCTVHAANTFLLLDEGARAFDVADGATLNTSYCTTILRSDKLRGNSYGLCGMI